MRQFSETARRQQSTSQRQRLSDILHAIGGQRVEFEFVSGDPEATAFAAQLISVFATSGWTIEELSEVDSTNMPGLGLIVRSMQDAPAHMQLLRDTLVSFGIGTNVLFGHKQKPKQLKLRVGHKLVIPWSQLGAPRLLSS